MFSWVLYIPLNDINEERNKKESICGRKLWKFYWLAYSLNLLVEPHTKELEKQMSFERVGKRIFETKIITWGKQKSSAWNRNGKKIVWPPESTWTWPWSLLQVFIKIVSKPFVNHQCYQRILSSLLFSNFCKVLFHQVLFFIYILDMLKKHYWVKKRH